MPNRIKSNKGSAVILMIFIILTAILTVVLASSEIIKNGLTADKTQQDSTKAYFSAESAAERILWHVRYGSDISCANNNYCIKFSQNFDPGATLDCSADNCIFDNSVSDSLPDYKYYIKYESISGGNLKLTCYGTFQGMKRAVELTY